MLSVSIVKGPKSPNTATIFKMVKRAIDLVGGMNEIVGNGPIVALKPNIVTGKFSGRGVTTDPRVVEALIKLSFEAGAEEVLVVEGAGYFSPTEESFKLSGIQKVAERNGAEVVNVDKDDLVEVEVPNPLILGSVSISRRFWEADVRVNIPVMKTHDQMLMTLGMKNLKGILPKPQKRLFHRVGLARAIVDLNKAVHLDLTVVDAIHAMEGFGPAFGDIIEMDAVLASTDVYSLDVVGARVMGVPPEEIEYLRLASEQGLVSFDHAYIEVVGEPISRVKRVFKRPPMSLLPHEGVEIIERGACSACRGTICSVFYDLKQMGLLSKIRGLTIVVGPQAKPPENIDGEPLIMGTCLKRLANRGRYVIGCPPNNDKMIEAIREICKI